MVICLLAIAFAYFGIKRGFISEVFRFVAVLGGFLVSFIYYRDLQGALGISSNEYAAGAITFVVLFLAVFAVIMLAGYLLKNVASALTLGWADRILGMALGLLKVAVIAWAACLSISSFNIDKVQNEFNRSVVYRGYKAMPKFFSLDAMEDKRNAILGRSGEKKADKPKKGPTGDELIDGILGKE
jgi:uncharacterized membrane protein required for colicin V production